MRILINKIKEFKNIVPEERFSSYSRMLILKTPQARRIFFHLGESFRYSLALGLGALLLIIALGGFSYLRINSASPIIVGSLNAKSIAAEAQYANFEIKLAEAEYFDNSSRVISVALSEVSQNNPDHLNENILRQELKNIESPASSGKTIDELLNEIVL